MNEWRPYPGLSLASGRVQPEDAARQERTAEAVLERLSSQPGVILADEVGMGKTFVAMAVAAGVAESTGRKRPVVVMVPPAVAYKWPSDWRVFQEHCLPEGSDLRATTEPVTKGSEFLKLLDDPPDRRAHIIFMKHGALRTALRDPLIELAVVRQAFLHQRSEAMRSRRAAFPKWASRILNDSWFTHERTSRLLDLPAHRWFDACVDRPSMIDEPVPELIDNAIRQVDLGPIREALLQLPLKSSANLAPRIAAARAQLRVAMADVWKQSIGGLDFRLPLLILDEAHHVKNPNQLASLFADSADSDDPMEGALANKFERMLFLTATPFQLGHRELIKVIGRFGAVRLTAAERARFDDDVADLRNTLDRSQADVSVLDGAWGRLRPEDVAALPEAWWMNDPADLPEPVRPAAVAAVRALDGFASAHHALRPWVIRHCRDRRRDVIPGAGIFPGATETNAHLGVGLEVEGEAVLPFLLAARAESLISLMSLRRNQGSRAIFTEGLASSYDAFRHRAKDDAETSATDADLPEEFRWYLDQIAAFIPRDDRKVLDSHPKIAATTARVLDLWGRGEKVLVFCYFRATGRALRRSISAAIEAELEHRARHAGTSITELQRRSINQLDKDAPAARLVAERVERIGDAAGLPPEDREALADTTLRFLRTPAFQTRFLDLSLDLSDSLRRAFDNQGPTGAELVNRIAAFAERVQMLVDREREDLWADLTSVQTGDTRYVDADDTTGATSLERSLPNVRLANGETEQRIRRRLMRTFNSPFFPEVLIASSVMSEGVDLHLDCRHVIHHDLDWNPSELEQRTGRVDRVGSKAERVGESIVVFEPFLAGTQDERVYRVVKDRERWFNVVMGGSIPGAAWERDRIAERVELPAELASKLTFDLAVR